MRRLTLENLVIDALFAANDNIKLVGALLEPLWTGLDAPVAVQHVQQAVLSVQRAVLVLGEGHRGGGGAVSRLCGRMTEDTEFQPARVEDNNRDRLKKRRQTMKDTITIAIHP